MEAINATYVAQPANPSESDIDVQPLWMAFVHNHTAHLSVPPSQSTSESRAQTHASLQAHFNASHVVQSKLGQRMNWLTPIYTLPDEVLARIFVLVCAARTPNAALPTDLMTVCHRWCSIIRGFPGTWVYPPLYTSRDKVTALLARSKSSALHLCWEHPSLSAIVFQSAHQSVDPMGVLSPLVARSCTIKLEASIPALLGLINQFGEDTPAVNLESLDVNVDSSGQTPTPTPPIYMTPAIWPRLMFDTPQLRHLRLSNFGYFDWSHPLLCDTLTSLEVSFFDHSQVFVNPFNHPGPIEAAPCSYDRLLDVLDRLQSLEELVLLRCLSTALLLGPPVDERRKVAMKNLRVLNVFDTSGACAVLNRNLALSRDAVALYMFGWAGPVDSSNIAKLGDSCISYVEATKWTVLHVVINTSPDRGRSIGFNFSQEGRTGKVALSALLPPPINSPNLFADIPNRDTWHHEIISTMAENLPLDKVRGLDIELDASLPPLPCSMWLNSLSRACNTQELVVEARAAPILSSILRRRIADSDSSVLPFPHLHEVTMVGGSQRELNLLKWAADQAVRTGERYPFGITFPDVKIEHFPGGPVVYRRANGKKRMIYVYGISDERYQPRTNSESASKALQDRDHRRRARKSMI
ncbi:unnamed protein product [Peniophora sp. CBMAI 1063]|nr:unnamed protein product [Peniophora sp. CBMAI 1063]